MKEKTRYITIICLIMSMVFTQFTSVYACSGYIVYNHWYQINYEIQNESLPNDVRVRIIETKTQDVFTVDEPVFYPENVDGYNVDPDLVAASKLRFTNASDSPIYLNSLSDNVVEPSEIIEYDIRRNIVLPERNPQSAGGVKEPPPPPFRQEFFITQDTEHFTIPITVTYSLNPFYDENIVGEFAPLIDYLNITDTIVFGEVITKAADVISDDGDVTTYLRVRVEEQLFGDGPEEIEIGPFGGVCGFSMGVGYRGYFLLDTPENINSTRYDLKYPYGVSMPQSVFKADSRNAAYVKAAIQAVDPTSPQTIDTTTAIPLTDEPIYSLFLPYISR